MTNNNHKNKTVATTTLPADNIAIAHENLQVLKDYTTVAHDNMKADGIDPATNPEIVDRYVKYLMDVSVARALIQSFEVAISSLKDSVDINTSRIGTVPIFK